MPAESRVLFIGLLLSVASNNLLAPLLPAIRSSMGVSLASMGTFVSTYGFGRLIVDLPSGALTTRVGPRPVAILGIGLNIVFSIAGAFAPNFGLLLIARVGTGVGAGLLATVILSTLSSIAPPSIRGKVMSLYQVANNLGIAAYPLIGGAVGTFLGWRWAFIVAAVAATASGLVLAPVLRRIGNLTYDTPATKVAGNAGRNVRRAVPALGLIAIFFGVVANMINRHGFRNTVLPLFAASHLGLSEVQTATGITLMSLTGILVTIPGAALGDRIGRKRIVVVGLAILAFGDFMFPIVANSYLSFVIAGMVVGTGDFFSSSQTALLSDLVPGPRRATVLGAYRFCVDLGALIGPSLLARIMASDGANAAITTAAAILAAAAVVGLVGIPNGPRRPTSQLA